MALKDITKNKAYIQRKEMNAAGWGSNPDAFNSNWTDPTAPIPEWDRSDPNMFWDDSFTDQYLWTGFDYTTWTFANWNKPVASTKIAYASPSISSPTTAANMNTAQTTATIWGRSQIKLGKQYIQDKNLEDIYDPEKDKLQQFDFKTKLSDTFNKGITDKSALYSELMKDGSFASLDSTKQQEEISKMSAELKAMNDAKKSADMNAQDFDVWEYLKGKWFDLTTWDVREVQKWWDEITQTLKYKGTIYDNNLEDLDFKKQQTIKQINQNVEKIATDVNRSVDDVSRQAQQTLAMGEKVWALKGFGKSSNYVQWLQEVQRQAMQNIQRLQQDLARVESLAWEDKALAMQEYEKNMKRAKEDFDYAMRDVISQSSADLNNVMGKYSGKKLWEMLDNVAYDVIQKRLQIENQYINNMKGANDVVNQQFEQYKAMDDYTDKQRAEFTSILNANDWEALASMSAKDIENYVSQGYLSQEQGIAYYNSMISKSVWALSQYWIPTQQDIDSVINSVKNGLSPLQAIAWVVQNNPNRYSSVKDKFMSVWANSSIFNTQTWQFMTAPWSTGWASAVSTGYTWKPVPVVAPQTIQQNVQKTVQQYPIWSKWWQCGSFVNNYLQSMWLWRMFVDPIDKKVQMSNSNTPTVWSVAIMDSPSSPKYGHVAIVTKVNPDWSFQTIESNKWGEEKVFTRTMRAWSANYWFFDPQLWLQSWGQTSQAGIDDIISFNDDVTRRKMSKEEVKRIGEQKQSIMKNPKSSISDILQRSAGGKSVWAEQSKSFAKYSQAIWQLDSIQKQISDMETWPILWALRNLNPYDTSAQVLKSKLQWLVPTIARWVYGEVWVLTDQDVQLYAKTLPNLKSTSDVNKWVLAYTLDILAWGYKKQLSSLAWQWYDVSWMEWEYENIKWQAEALKNEIGIYSTPESALAPAQSVLDKLTQQAQANKSKTTTTPKTTASTSLSARRKTQGK